MRAPIIVNESNDEERPGAIDVFATISDAEAYIEPWFVEEPHWVYDVLGCPLKIIAHGNRTKIVVDSTRPVAPETVRKLLIAFLSRIPTEEQEKITEDTTLEELATRAEAYATR